jgi:hypothetical protein
MPGFLAGVFVDPDEQTGALVLTNATSGLSPGALPGLLDIMRRTEPHVVASWHPLQTVDPAAMALIGTWYWGTTAYGLRLASDGLLHLLGLQGAGRESRFRQTESGWLGLDGYHAGETLRPVLRDGEIIALDLGSFVFTRIPYDGTAPIPGGVDPAGWQPT